MGRISPLIQTSATVWPNNLLKPKRKIRGVTRE